MHWADGAAAEKRQILFGKLMNSLLYEMIGGDLLLLNWALVGLCSPLLLLSLASRRIVVMLMTMMTVVVVD